MHSQDALDGVQVLSVASILMPANYTHVALGDDLALLRLATPAALGTSVWPVCLPRASHRFAHGASCWATGWGNVQENGEPRRPRGAPKVATPRRRPPNKGSPGGTGGCVRMRGEAGV